MTTVHTQHVDATLLEIFEAPPNPTTEPDVGIVDPFTSDELAAIAAYNERMRGVADCYDCVMHAGPREYVRILREHQDADGFEVALSIAGQGFKTLRDWYDALDKLYSDAADYSTMSGSQPSHSNAVDRLLRWEADQLVTAADRLRQAVALLLFGEAGPAAELGALTMSAGPIHPSCRHS